MSQTSTIRKWRFSILIGSGIVAAAALIYFSHVRINSEKTQGAIGNRDVYRDGKVDAASVGATPGSAPVATQVILESKEFQALAKNEAFQSVLSSGSFQQLARDKAFVGLISDASFVQMAQTQAFQGLIKQEGFRQALVASHNQLSEGLQRQELGPRNAAFAALQKNESFQSLARNEAFNSLLRNQAFSGLARNEAFINLLTSGSFQSLVKDQGFQRLASQSSFQNALLSGSAANLSAGLIKQ